MSGTVYFAEAVGTGHVKIGFTSHPFISQRIRQLQTGLWCDLRLLKAVEGDKNTERSFHVRFDAQHVRNEWFRLEGKLKEFLEA